MISQLSPIKSDRNLFIHFSLLLLPLVISLLVVVFNNNLQLKNIVPYVMGIVSSIFIFASLVERKNPSIRQIENCKRNPYLLIASVIFSSGAFQCLVLSLISFIMAFTFGNWILLEYSLLLKIIVYFAIYSFIANVVYLFYQKFSTEKVFIFIVAIAFLLGIIGLFHENSILLSMIPWDGENVKLSIDSLIGIYIFVMIGNLCCYKNTVKEYFSFEES